MCEHCEHAKPIIENANSVMFIVGNRMILQDKTTPKFYDSKMDSVVYDSKYVMIERCPICGELAMAKSIDNSIPNDATVSKPNNDDQYGYYVVKTFDAGTAEYTGEYEFLSDASTMKRAYMFANDSIHWNVHNDSFNGIDYVIFNCDGMDGEYPKFDVWLTVEPTDCDPVHDNALLFSVFRIGPTEQTVSLIDAETYNKILRLFKKFIEAYHG